MRTVNLGLFDHCVALRITLRKWGNSAKAPTEAVTLPEGTDGKRVRVGEKLIVCEQYDKLSRYLDDAKKWCLYRGMPSHFMEGVFVFRQDSVEEIDKHLRECSQNLKAVHIPAFIDAYPAAVENARQHLTGKFWNPKHYPEADAMWEAWGIDWEWVSFSVPENIPPAVREAEQLKAQAKWDDATDEIIMDLRQSVLDLLQHTVDRLTPGADGQRKRIDDSLVENAKSFFANFSFQNILDDQRLAEVVEQARTVFQGTTTSALKEFGTLRQKLASEFTTLAQKVDGLIKSAPARRIVMPAVPAPETAPQPQGDLT